MSIPLVDPDSIHGPIRDAMLEAPPIRPGSWRTGVRSMTRHQILVGLALLVGGCDHKTGAGDTAGDGNQADAAPLVKEPVAEPTEDPATDAIDAVNQLRAQAGLLPLTADQKLARAAQAHADYVLANWASYQGNGWSLHDEQPGLGDFTGQNGDERAARFGWTGLPVYEVISNRPSGSAAVVSWIETLYHRLPVLTPRVSLAGYGQAAKQGLYVNVLIVGAESVDETALAMHPAVKYPAGDAADVPAEWDGNEVPQPTPPPGGYPSGPVITLQYPAGVITEAKATLTGPGGPVPCVVTTSAEDELLGPGNVVLLPHDSLHAFATYSVAVSGKRDGAAFSETWEFTTRAEICSLLKQDCRLGKGCYMGSGGPYCDWTGTSPPGGWCEYLNDCAAGSTCVAGRCRAMCDYQETLGIDPCSKACTNGAWLISGTTNIGACLGTPCYGVSQACPEGQGCYPFGATDPVFGCYTAGTKQTGEGCASAMDCAPGHTCIVVETSPPVCTKLCAGPYLPACVSVCPGLYVEIDPATHISVCL
jgi:hypothetical protein